MLRVGGRVQRRQDGASGVGEQVHLVQAQVDAQRFDIADEPVHAEGGRIGRIGGGADAAMINQYKLPGGVKAAQVPEVLRRAARPAGQAHQRRAVT